VRKKKQQTDLVSLDITTPEGRAEIERLAEEGDRAVIPKLRELLRSPEGQDLVRGTNWDRVVRTAWVGAIEKNTEGLAFRVSTELQMDQLEKELAGDNSTLMERLVIKRVVICWVALQYAESQRALYIKVSDKPSRDIRKLNDQRCERLQRMYLASIKSLAQVKRLRMPTLQQINVYSGTRPESQG
jgi:hypothetical protein